MPGGVLDQVKCPFFGIFGLPALGQGGHEIACLVDPDQGLGEKCLPVGVEDAVVDIDILHLISGADDQLAHAFGFAGSLVLGQG